MSDPSKVIEVRDFKMIATSFNIDGNFTVEGFFHAPPSAMPPVVRDVNPIPILDTASDAGNGWHHVTLKRPKGKVRMFIDGKPVRVRVHPWVVQKVTKLNRKQRQQVRHYVARRKR